MHGMVSKTKTNRLTTIMNICKLDYGSVRQTVKKMPGQKSG